METELKSELHFGRTTFEKDCDDVYNLCETWWEDSLFYKLYKIEYGVDTSLFRTIDIAGGLIYTVGRNDEGKAIACYVGFKSPYMFNKNVTCANEVVWCVHKDHRNLQNLKSLLDAVDQLMLEEECLLWNLNVSNEPKYGRLGYFLEKLGYNLMDKCYSMYKGER